MDSTSNVWLAAFINFGTMAVIVEKIECCVKHLSRGGFGVGGSAPDVRT